MLLSSLMRSRATVAVVILSLTPPAVGADLRAALMASCLRGALPPVGFRAVCFVLAIVGWKRWLLAFWALANIQVLRLPPYHCECNPIETVWAYAKDQVAKKNVEYKLDDAMRFMREACLSCDATYWVKLMSKIIREEQQACVGNVLLRDIVERSAQHTIDDQLIVDLGSSSEKDDDDDAE